MNIESFRNRCLTRPGVTETFPFDEKTLVFKVMNKMFALTNVDFFDTIIMDDTVPDKLVAALIDHSYNLVVSGLSKKLRSALQEYNSDLKSAIGNQKPEVNKPANSNP